MKRLFAAGRDYGWLLALAVGLLAFALAWQNINPVSETADHIAEPVARSVGLLAGMCPSGWSLVDPSADHLVERRCWRDPWSVVLYPYLKKANYGINTKAGGEPEEVACEDIPNWPEDWCLE